MTTLTPTNLIALSWRCKRLLSMSVACTRTGDIRMTLKKDTLFRIPPPKDPAKNFSEFTDKQGKVLRMARDQISYLVQETFKLEINSYVMHKATLASNVQKAYSLVLGQCTDSMKAKLKSVDRWNIIKEKQDFLELLSLIKSVSYRVGDPIYQPLSLHLAKSNFHSLRQLNISNSEYYQHLNNMVMVVTSLGCSLHNDSMRDIVAGERFGSVYEKLTVYDCETIDSLARYTYLSVVFLKHVDMRMYGPLVQDLDNDFVKVQDSYPKQLVQAYLMLNDYKFSGTVVGVVSNGVAFSQSSVDDGDFEKECFICRRKGYTIYTCPGCKFKRNKNKNEKGNKQTTHKGKKKIVTLVQ